MKFKRFGLAFAFRFAFKYRASQKKEKKKKIPSHMSKKITFLKESQGEVFVFVFVQKTIKCAQKKKTNKQI